MTLSEMRDLVCAKVNLVETDDKAACKTFLQRWHETLWNGQLWKDSIVEYVLALDTTAATANPFLPSKGVVLLPAFIQRVLAVRNDTRHLNVQRPEFYFRRDFDSFAANGAPQEFFLLPPCVWEWDAASFTFLTRANGADSAVQVKLDVLDTDNVTVNRETITLSDATNDLAETERLDALIKAATQGNVLVQAYPSDITVTGAGSTAANTTYERNGTANGKPAWGESDGVNPGIYWDAGSQQWRVQMADGGYYYNTQDTDLPQQADPLLWVPAISAVGPVPTFDSLVTCVTSLAATLNEPKRQRIRLVPMPESNAEITLRVLGKRFAPTFSDDNDSPAITGSELCLLRFAESYMWERARQFGFANTVKGEAQALLQDLISQETVQQAHSITLVPEQGFKTEWDLYSANPLTF